MYFKLIERSERKTIFNTAHEKALFFISLRLFWKKHKTPEE